ncbi:hypothetical protein AYO21_01989 [Fonsecaea monophora]|uniref:Uncharacterized protein n=1 Tax=Fonsecaea monophora TaxID=254056 RepID=A0A177FK59_9EURO|nr:hypothetical protein AYO21_01989 [Fonsecaea monophora]KAH0844689.1 hypothetical protein FOPE_09453 [Fonsecaea pedrosoi]OAG43762.1 hypothetical protein AYO21_01989 [Fonsecaea monophora]
MEALGLAFAVAPLLGSGPRIIRFCRGWNRVPTDLDRAATRVQNLQTMYDALSLLHSKLPEEQRQLVPDLPKAIALALESLPKTPTKRSKISHLRWLTGDRDVHERVVAETQQDMLLAGLILGLQRLAQRAADDRDHDHLSHDEAAQVPQGMEITTSNAEEWAATKEAGTLTAFAARCCMSFGGWVFREISRVFGPNSNLSRNFDSMSTLQGTPAHYASMHNLPQILLYVAIVMRRLVWQHWLKASPGQDRLPEFHRVSPEQELLLASKAGDVVRMQQLLVLEQVSPFYATTTDGVTALNLAIEHGHHEAVKLLLAQGALVNRTFGLKETSPLCWALQHRRLEICRTLLSYGASLDHFTALDWTPLYYLWPWDMEEGFQHPPAAEFISMLRATGENFHTLHEDHVDNHGWSVMHRAAIFADPADLQLLLDYGVNAFTPHAYLDWMPLHFVVEYGISDNFPVLFHAYEREFGSRAALELRDSRGWTPLHMAAANGHFELVRVLLERGANRKALTGPVYDSDMPESVRGKRCSPQELAWASGELNGHWFDTIAAAIPEDQWFDAPEYPEDSLLRKAFKFPRQVVSKEKMKNVATFFRRSRQS